MTVTSIGMASALQGLAQALEAPRRPGVTLGTWRWSVRQRMAAVRDALLAEAGHGSEGWFAARETGLLRERAALLTRLGTLAPRVLEDPDVDTVRAELHRLVADISHHEQRLHDLAYDEVEAELGGSE
ncbi:MAG TPA: hypothetical protein VFT70_04205 [Nocardioides sp.]|nr:hypothetical protein [Nocardioides sp.]